MNVYQISTAYGSYSLDNSTFFKKYIKLPTIYFVKNKNNNSNISKKSRFKEKGYTSKKKQDKFSS